MDTKTAQEITAKLDELTAERKPLYAVVNFHNTVSNDKTVEQVVGQIAPENAQEIIAAYKSDKIGAAWFSFVEKCNLRIQANRNEANALPSIPVSAWMQIK